jgi:type VI secretion system protein ImpK
MSTSTVASPGRVENLALIFQEVLTAIVRLRANRQELSDAESFRFQMREALKAAVQEARNRGAYAPDDIKMATLGAGRIPG